MILLEVVGVAALIAAAACIAGIAAAARGLLGVLRRGGADALGLLDEAPEQRLDASVAA